ncbi:heavy-metal-associated domain-containing protein [Mariniluteicoccus flavus]
MTTTDYTIQGMTCEHCAKAITSEVSDIDGVNDVDVRLEGGRMTVTSDGPVSLDKITEAVEEAGDYIVALG